MDYMENLKSSFKLWWEYKYLWLFGIIVAVFTNSNSLDFNNNTNNDSNRVSTFNEQTFNNWRANIQSYFESIEGPILMLLLIIGVVVGVLFIAGAIYFGGKAKTALVKEGMGLYKGKDVAGNFKQAWYQTGDYWIQLFIMNAIFGLFILALIIIILIPVLLSVVLGTTMGGAGAFASISLICGLVCVGGIIAIALGITIGIIKELASREIVLHNKKAIEAIRISLRIFKEKWLELLLSALVLVIPALGFGTIMLIVMAPLGLIAGMVVLIGTAVGVNSIITVIFSVIVQILFMVIGALVSGPLVALTAIYWNMVYDQLKDIAPNSREESVEVV